MGEVDHPDDAEDEAEPDRDGSVEPAEQQARHERLGECLDHEALSCPGEAAAG